MLIDIKRSEWIDFKKELCKEDKQRFDRYTCVHITNNEYSHKGENKHQSDFLQ
jgi:hypothetical protein